MEILNYQSAAKEALNNRDIKRLKALHLLKGLQIYQLENASELSSITPKEGTGFIFTDNVLTYLEGLFILSALNGIEFKYKHLYEPGLTSAEVLEISASLEAKY